MSLTYNSRIIADAQVQRIFGLRGIGCYQLRFSLDFNLPNWGPPHEKIVLSGLRSEIYVGAKRGEFKLLGYATPETPLSLETKEVPQKQSILFLLDLSEQQLFALESMRNGGSLDFRVTVSGEARGSNDRQWAREELRHEVTLSDWSRVLRELGYADVLVIGVELPIAESGHELRPAVELVRQAHGDLIGGRYDSVVARCRQALESVRTVLGQKKCIDAALEKFCKGHRKAMNKHEREMLIGEAARHYTHLAHHVDQDGEQQWYSRGDATFLLTITAATICSEVAGVSVVLPGLDGSQPSERANDSPPRGS